MGHSKFLKSVTFYTLNFKLPGVYISEIISKQQPSFHYFSFPNGEVYGEVYICNLRLTLPTPKRLSKIQRNGTIELILKVDPFSFIAFCVFILILK